MCAMASPPNHSRLDEAGSPSHRCFGRLPCRCLSSVKKETELSFQIHFRSLPWRRSGANKTKNMQKINSLVRSGLATSFSLRRLALLWEALIIFCCFTHSQKYDETRTECGYFFCLITVSSINYSPMRLNCISYSKGASFCLQRIRPQTSGLSCPPQPKHMGISVLGFTLQPHSPLDPSVPMLGANPIRWCGWWGRHRAEAGFGAVSGRQWDPHHSIHAEP